MDTRTGRIISLEDAETLRRSLRDRQFIQPMVIPPTKKQMRRGKVGRNDPCPCGSKKKFKRCCLTV
jgi:uncharacterized protein YecA (UPF0149 family)